LFQYYNGQRTPMNELVRKKVNDGLHEAKRLRKGAYTERTFYYL